MINKMKKSNIKAIASVMAAALLLSGCININIPEKGNNTENTKASEAPTKEAKATATPETEKEDEPSKVKDISEASDIEIYEAFLGMGAFEGVKAKIDAGVELSYADFDMEHSGEELTFEELTGTMEALAGNYDGASVPKPCFALLSVNDSDLLAIKYDGMNIYCPGDESFSVLILKNEADGLHITHSFSDWARNLVDFCSNGYIYCQGSAGAGEWICEGGMITADGKYQYIYMKDQLQQQWMCGAEGLDPDCYEEAYRAEDGDDQDSNLVMNVFNSGKNTWYSYSDNGQALTDKDIKYLQLLEQKGIEFESEEDIYKKIVENNKELGLDDDYTEYPPVLWNEITPGKDPVVPGELNSWTEKSDFLTYAGQEVVLDEIYVNEIKEAERKPVNSMSDFDFDGILNSNQPMVAFIDSASEGKETFSYYMVNGGETLIITPDDKVVQIGYIYDFQYDMKPELFVDDMDNDGDNELLIKYLAIHGTGIYKENAIVLDKCVLWDDSVLWMAYNLTPDIYSKMYMGHQKLYDCGDELIEDYDGDRNSIPKLEGEEWVNLIVDSHVEIDYRGRTLEVSVTPNLYSKERMMEPVGGGTIKIKYMGDGVFEEAK